MKNKEEKIKTKIEEKRKKKKEKISKKHKNKRIPKPAVELSNEPQKTRKQPPPMGEESQKK